MNGNQFSFTPGKSTTDAILAVTDYIEEGIKQRDITILISLDVKGAFDAAWWPSIIHALKEFSCPKDLFNLAKSYFSERKIPYVQTAKKIERELSKGCPQGSNSGPGFWNILFNSLLNLDFGKRTKAIAFAGDLLIAVKAGTAKEAENFENIEICKITKWAANKIKFNEQKLKVMLITRRKKREKTDVTTYLNKSPLEQVNSIKYLGVILDSKLNFREQLISTVKKSTTLIHTLSRSAKLNWGLQQGALNTIYKGVILLSLHMLHRSG
jgi:retron-type reverse transcriptase